MGNYSDLLRDPRWQRKRLEIMKRDDFQCKACGERIKTLNVHHFLYLKGKMPWEYPDSNFITLCQDCHAEEELYVKNQHEGFVKLNRIAPFGITRMWLVSVIFSFMYVYDRESYDLFKELLNDYTDTKSDQFSELYDKLESNG